MKSNSYQLKELASIQTGPFGSQLHQEDYCEIGTPIVTVEHLGKKNFGTQNLPKVSEYDTERLKKYSLKTGDIVFSRVGSVDRCSYVSAQYDKWLFSGRCLRIRVTDQKLNPEYLYYYFCQNYIKEYVRKVAVGATMPSINTKIMGEIPIEIPDRKIQDKIVNLISSFDDKIEVNNKITNILWSLISFSYQTIIRNPSCSQGKLSDISQFVNEKADCTEASVDSYIGTENIFPNKAGYTFAKSVPNTGKVTKFSSGDTLISNIRPYFKKIVFAETAGYCSNDVLCFRPKTTENSKFLYSILYQDGFFDYMTLGSKGTKMPRGDKRHIMNFNILIPNDESLLKFNAFTAPIFSLISNIRSQNKLLTQFRELILPKLLSGEIVLKNQ